MDISTASLDLGPLDYLKSAGAFRPLEGHPQALRPAGLPDQELLRRVAWEIGERQAADRFTPRVCHVSLAMVHSTQGFVHWRILHDWVEQKAGERAADWDGCRMIVRLYDVSYITFNGLNAHRVQDHVVKELTGSMFVGVPSPGTWQLAEVGFQLRNGEFLPAARSPVVPFAPEGPSRHGGSAALLVHSPGRIEHIGNVWDQEHELRERRRPHLREPLRIAALAFASRPSGQDSTLATFVSELAGGHRACGHEVHVFVPASAALGEDREVDGVHYHPLTGVTGGSPIEAARAFARVAEDRLSELPPFDLIHLHEWMSALGGWLGHRPTVLSLGSIEASRRNGQAPDELSRKIEQIEREVARSAGCVLTPAGLRDRVMAELGLPTGRVHAFAMEGRLPNEWESTLDVGQVKMRHGVGPLDRMVLFIGPLEHAAGVDLLIEALPTLLRRWGNLRLAYVGNGPMQGALERRAGELGVSWAVRFLGHQEGLGLKHLLRASEALVLPSRYRIPMDDNVVDLARKAARAVVTTHGGPAHLVKHEENGLITYDNPGSMVWALDRILGDSGHTERMGENGRRGEGGTQRWSEVARHYLESCVAWFPELTVTRMLGG
jgi:glycosyltransferase involved in cell wall biosynthesis